MTDKGSITHWIQEIQTGNSDAAQALWERYFERLVRLAGLKLRGTSQRVADEEDLALSVFDNFCRAAGQGRFPNLADRDSLWRLLVRMAAQKSIDLHRHHSRQRRGGGVVRGESALGQSPDGNETLAIAQVIGDSPTPEFSAMIAEQMQRLMDLLGDEPLRELALGKMEGFTNEEMANRLGCSVRTIERRLRLIRAKCTEEFLND